MKTNYRLGNLELENRFFLSPMLEPNDIAFRLLCKQAGAALTFTGMVNPLSKQTIHFDDKPALQLFNHNTKGFKEFVKKHDDQVSLWDFNLGCPSKLSKKLAHGAFMHKDFDMIRKILTIIRKNSSKPITIKLRKSDQAIKLSKHVEDLVDAIGIHPRTAEQGYSGEADYEFALKLKEAVRVPIIYSGDVNLENVEKILKDFDFVFIGRASMGNPGIFAELIGETCNVSFEKYLELAEKYDIPFRKIKYHAMQFSKGMKDAKEKRRALIFAKDIEGMKEAMKTHK